jgi:hypothetical protein
VNLGELLPELYLSWLLLLDVLDLASLPDPANSFEPVSRAANPNAIAARHWYKTACEAQMSAEARLTVPVGLPGHFSVRGDWFLVVASASRSSLLADRALDVLSSRRANFVRLQSGLGLPPRDIESDWKSNPTGRKYTGPGIRTCLTAPGPVRKGVKVNYPDLCKLGEQDGERFHWLWRSSIANYDFSATVWQKWLVRVAAAWHEYRRERGGEWTGGFEMYDLIRCKMDAMDGGWKQNAEKWAGQKSSYGKRWAEFENIIEEGLKKGTCAEQFRDSWRWFTEECELLRDLLRQAMGGSHFVSPKTKEIPTRTQEPAIKAPQPKDPNALS